MKLSEFKPVTIKHNVMWSVLILALMSSSILIDLFAPSAHAQTNSTLDGSSSINSMATKKVKVGDIDVAYKIFGKGKPLLLIAGSGASMDMWDPHSLETVIHKPHCNHI